MKAIFLLFSLFSLFCVTAFGQVPDVVEEEFAKKYPGVDLSKWELDSTGSWEARFENEGTKYRADFKPNGVWQKTEHSLTFEQLPSDVKAAIELKHGSQAVRDVEAVDSSLHGKYYQVEFIKGGDKFDVMFDEKGKLLDRNRPPTEKGFFHRWMDQSQAGSGLPREPWVIAYKALFNLFTVFIYAYLIYYRRHHDHKMLFLLLAFNLFLFPIFLSTSLVTAGFGFTIFALLALVRLRSEAFDKAEIAYLLGAISLTFVNTLLPVFVDLPSAATILLTAAIADRRSLWRDRYHKIDVDYAFNEKEKMVDEAFLRERLSEEYCIEVNEISINRVLKGEVRLTMMYRDLPKAKREQLAEVQEQERIKAAALKEKEKEESIKRKAAARAAGAAESDLSE
jgi:hypothetical protein